MGAVAKATSGRLSHIPAAVDDPLNTAKLIERGLHSVYELAGQKLATAQADIVVQSAFLMTKRETALDSM